ncbi:TetR/AcrR family transcriptional regulator [uncultured Umboniibacter sp.]|uniref:TetR/AcrR family transcriptional regulator n=1 Tax=uncultured Umboniibacter sp. TaxID=1798917 RepID=UPI002624483E|nr:TetR/AcrR family transcriptional regulator [uncultured Umboniibacter sp.]
MSTTSLRILDQAERLFAEQGFNETSLRAITSAAEVNIASVNYHFGSKKNLIQAVFNRYLEDFYSGYNTQISSLSVADSEVSQRQAIEAAIIAMLGTDLNVSRARRFMMLLRHAYAQQQGHLRRFIKDHYNEDYRRMIQHLAGQNLQESSKLKFYWQLQFLMGAAMFSLAEFDTLDAIADAQYHSRISTNELLDLFIPTALAILNPHVAE